VSQVTDADPNQRNRQALEADKVFVLIEQKQEKGKEVHSGPQEKERTHREKTPTVTILACGKPREGKKAPRK